MMNHQLIERLAELTDEHVQGLCDVLVDCVEGGASVGFIFPFTRDRAVEFWTRVAQGVAAGKRAFGGIEMLMSYPEQRTNIKKGFHDRGNTQSTLLRCHLYQ